MEQRSNHVNGAGVIDPFEFYVIYQSFATEDGELVGLASCVHQGAVIFFQHPWQHVQRVFYFVNLCWNILDCGLDLLHDLSIVIITIPIFFEVLEYIFVVLPQLKHRAVVRLNQILAAQMDAWPLLEVELVAEDAALDQVGDRDAHLHDFHEVLFK
jgi:hypothetical protein